MRTIGYISVRTNGWGNKMTMDEFKNRFSLIAKEMMEAEPENDFLFKQIWKRLTDLMCEDIHLAIKFLDNASRNEIDIADSVFEDIAQRIDSQEYIDCLYRLCEKFPELKPDVELAEAFMEDLRLKNKNKNSQSR